MESMGVVCAIVRRGGRDRSVTSQNMTVKFLTALDMVSASLAYVSVSQAGRAHSVSMVSAVPLFFKKNSDNCPKHNLKNNVSRK